MQEILNQLMEAVELGKVDIKSPYPPQLKGLEGAYELTGKALGAGIDPQAILENALVPAMEKVGIRFSENKIFVPQMLMSARAMGASMIQLKPFFTSGQIKTRGTFIIGTVKGDLHDIGKNLVAMMVEGAGWTVVDLGVDVPSSRYLEALNNHPGAVVGLSALLTTTMINMGEIVTDIKAQVPETKIFIGGAPVNNEFCHKIGADFYAPDPQGVVEQLNRMAS
ncbi:MAG: cobalamin B12-binding domain-containing protein [Bacteroidales bacterium]|nr:cobalamin B12-binding domain-containing protein [Bacteroidales bacterium]